MSVNSRSEISSGSQDGSRFVTCYTNGQRGHFLSASSLDRLGSFHESHHESSISTSGQNISGVSQSSCTELSLLDNQKYARQVELKRVINAAIIGKPTEVSSSGTLQAKPLVSLGLDELKRVKASVSDCHLRASRERVKFLDEAISKLDKLVQSQPSRKRFRSETVPSERRNSSLLSDRSAVSGIPLKSALLSSQNQAISNSVDLGFQRADERNKSLVPNKRVRTSLADSRLEGRLSNVSLPRPSGLPDRERDLLKTGSSSLSQADEDYELLAGKGAWELKKKRKRSGLNVPAAANGSLDEERERKLNVQVKLGFRSGPVHGITSTQKRETSMQHNPLSACVMARNEPEGGSFVSEKRERSIGLEKDRTLLKNNNKTTIHNENQAASSPILRKGKASRTPRPSSVGTVNCSPRFTRASPTFDGWSSGTNRVQQAVVPNTKTCSAATRSSPPPVAKCAGKRSKKSGRIARRIDTVASIPNQVDDRSFAEGFAYPETASCKGSKSDPCGVLGSGVQEPPPVCSTLSQSKLKNENLSTSTGFPGSENLEQDGENKSMEKNKKNASSEAKFKPTAPGLQTLVLPTKNSKVGSKEGNGDGVHRQGRSGRGSAAGRVSISQASDKADVTSNSKQLRSMGPISDKVESKPSRPVTKKSASDRKTLTRCRRPVNSGSSDLTGEMEDDHGELLAAIEAAKNASSLACSGSFWKEREEYFRIVTQDDLDYVKEQGDVMCDATQANVQNSDLKPFSITLLQRLLSALICQDDSKELVIGDDSGQENYDCMSEVSPHGNCFEIGIVQKYSDRVEPDMATSVAKDSNERANSSIILNSSNGHKKYLSGLYIHSENNGVCNIFQDPKIDSFKSGPARTSERLILGWERNQDELHSGYEVNEKEYQKMSLDERILLELNSIGLFPEAMPDPLQGSDDSIANEANKLKIELQQQVFKNRTPINKLEQAISDSCTLDERERERVAMNQLVLRAFNQYLGSRGGRVSERSAGSKAAKQTALAFVKRTMNRCRNFDTGGTSYFSEPGLKEKLFCIASKETTAKLLEEAADGKTIHTSANAEGTPNPPDMKQSGDSVTAIPNSGRLVVRRTQKKDKGGKGQSDSGQASPSSLEQSGGKDELCCIRTRKKELPLEDVGSSAQRDASVLTGSLHGGAKGKRSEREREVKGQNKESIIKMNNTRAGLQVVGNSKGERKVKIKPRQRTAQLVKGVNGLLGKPTEEPCKSSPTATNLEKMPNNRSVKDEFAKGNILNSDEGLPCDADGPIDLSSLPLPGEDFSDAWFSNVGDDILADAVDFAGLPEPQDRIDDIM